MSPEELQQKQQQRPQFEKNSQKTKLENKTVDFLLNRKGKDLRDGLIKNMFNFIERHGRLGMVQWMMIQRYRGSDGESTRTDDVATLLVFKFFKITRLSIV